MYFLQTIVETECFRKYISVDNEYYVRCEHVLECILTQTDRRMSDNYFIWVPEHQLGYNV